MSTKEYYSNIDECAENKTDQLIPNGLAEHAVYLMSKMFSNAIEHVRLFTGELTDAITRNVKDGTPQTVPVYTEPKLIEAARNFLKREGSILDILVQDDSGNIALRGFVQIIQKMKAEGEVIGTVNIRKANPEIMSLKNHFMVMDDMGYRLETEHKNTKAVANFGDKEFSCSLAKVFDNVLFKNGTPLLII